MKKNKMTKTVMDRVIMYEKGHTYHSIEIWLVMLLGLVSVLVLVLVDLINEMSETGVNDLLSLGFGDWGLAKEYGSMLWETIKYELPWFKISEALTLSFVIGIFLYIFSKRIKLAREKWIKMKEYFDNMDK